MAGGNYPAQIYARVFARANAISVLGLAFGPYGMGMIFDASSGATYTFAYLAGLAVSVLALVIVISASAGASVAAYRDVTPDQQDQLSGS